MSNTCSQKEILNAFNKGKSIREINKNSRYGWRAKVFNRTGCPNWPFNFDNYDYFIEDEFDSQMLEQKKDFSYCPYCGKKL